MGREEALSLAVGLAEALRKEREIELVVCPPYVHLDALRAELAETPIAIGAQNMHQEDEGAYTGEVSAGMLKDVGCRFVIIGHSERRQYYNETYADVNAKVKQAFRYGLTPIVCVGEALEQRKEGKAEEIVRTQVACALEDVDVPESGRLVVAYEPIWAIGTGETATPDQAQSMHKVIRRFLNDCLGERGLASPILYGGSMKPHNAGELLAQADIDGGLIGGASLDAADFSAIVEAGKSLASS